MSYSDISLAAITVVLAFLCLAGVHLSAKRVAKSRASRDTVVAAVMIAAWLGIAFVAVKSGWMQDYRTMPPPLAWIMLPSVIVVLLLVASEYGRRLVRGLKFTELVGLQIFRLPVELALFGYWKEGRIPVEMTFEGRNFDAFTAVSGLVLALLIKRKAAGKKVILAWNIVGLLLLLNVVVIAVLSAPGPFHVLKLQPLNSLPFGWPSIWILFAVLVALASHLLVFRKLFKS